MAVQFSDLHAAAAPLSPVGRVGRILTRAALFLVLMGSLLSAATTYSMPMWVVLLVGTVAVGPMLYWPTLGAAVLLSYLVLAAVRVWV